MCSIDGTQVTSSTSTRKEVRCGYRPRSILALDSEGLVLVGAQDGSITWINHEGESSAIWPEEGWRSAEVLFSCRKEGLLIGDRDGRIWRVQDFKKPAPELYLESPGRVESDYRTGDCDPVTCIARLDNEQLLVSWRESPARVIQRSNNAGELSAQHDTSIDIYGVTELLWLRLGGPYRFLAVAGTGSLWWLDRDEQDRWYEIPIKWSKYGLEEPGMVWSVAEAKSHTETERTSDQGVGFAIYLATDSGVYLLSGPSHAEDEEKLTITRLLLPGITGTCTAIAYPSLKSEEYRYLWAADSAGQIHLFRSDRRDRTQTSLTNPLWRRIHSQRYGARVLKAAVIRKGHIFKVVQARSNDTIKVTTYQQIRKTEAVSLCEWLWWGHIDTPPRKLVGLLTGTKKWHVEARLAEIIELVGESWPDELTKFLVNPQYELAKSALDKLRKCDGTGPSDESAPTGEAHMVNAIYLWAFTLLGTISRRLSPDQHEQACLGAIRWLQQIEQSMISEQSGPLTQWQRSLSRAVDGAIDYIRQWGVLGPLFTHRSEPLCQLAEFSKSKHGGSVLENLILSGLMFQRQLDIESTRPASSGRRGEAASSEPKVGAPIALDIRHLQLVKSSEDWLAVSWRTGAVDLYQVTRRDAPSGRYLGFQLQGPIAPGSGSFTEPRPLESEPHPFSKSIVLGQLSDQSYLLEAPGKGRTDGSMLHDEIDFRLSVLTKPGDKAESYSESLPGSGTVHSMLEVAPGLVLVGLGGGSRIEPQCMLVRVDLELEQKLAVANRFSLGGIDSERISDDQLRAAGAELHGREDDQETSVLSNGVNALTRMPGNDVSRTAVLAGCFDGQVWKIELEPKHGSTEELVFARAVRIGRLGSAVSSMSCSHVNGTQERVFAGSTDGTLLAWQRVDSGYASLWAVHESSAVISVDAFTAQLGKNESNDSECKNKRADREAELERRLVVAVTRGGHALVFSDRPDFSRPSKNNKQKHHRLIGPGSRLAAIDIGSRCFASVLIGSEPKAVGMVGRFAIAGSNGVQLVSLYFPERTESRKSKFGKILDLWQEYIGVSVCSAESPSRRPEIHVFMRHTETAYAADAFLPRMMIGWLFRSESRHQLYSRLPPPVEQWFPRLLRPVVTLDRRWDDPSADLGALLEEALRRAEQADDHALFMEILTVVLRRANLHLFNLTSPRDREVFAAQYQGILNTIGSVCEKCISRAPDIDIAIHRILAKELPDGDLLWRIFIDGPKPGAGTSTSEVLKNRLSLIKRWLDHDDPEVALDTLRASNLVLLAAGLRLDRKDGKWLEDRHASEIPWYPVRISSDIAKSFTERLDYSTRGAINDAVAHEIARAYTLSILVCPSSIALLPRWIYETNLPRRNLQQVNRQLELLTDLLPEVQLPDNARRFFDVLTEPLTKEDVEDVDTRYLSKYRRFDSKNEFGEHNARLASQIRIYDEIVIWFDELYKSLIKRPGAVNLTLPREHIDELRKIRSSEQKEYPFRHSSSFWNRAFDSLEVQLHDVRFSGDGPVRPEVALLSRGIADWCGEQRSELKRLKRARSIFAPMYQIYDRVLSNLEIAARNFRESSAVQKNIVVSVLDHGLLARLDEHLLELWEVAQVLDPLKSWSGEDSQELGYDSKDKTMPTAARFASHLLDRARSSECIPKNLRTLRGLLGFESMPNSGEVALGIFIDEYARQNRWDYHQGCCNVAQLTGKEAYFLQLCFDELAQNHREHGNRDLDPTIGCDSWKGASQLTICCHFFKHDRKEIKSILKRSGNLQMPVSVDDSSPAPKHGSGLYLANLAATTVGWKLVPRVQGCKLVFNLTKVDRGSS